MSTAAYEVQRAIYETLTSDENVTSRLAKSPSGGPAIFDHVPENQAFPYIKVGGGDTETNKPSTMRTPGRENTIMVHIYSRYHGQSEVKLIARATVERLDGTPLHLLPWKWTSTLYEFSEYLDEPDGITRHGVLRFRVRSQKDNA